MNMSTNKYQPFLFSAIFIFYTTLSHCSLASDTLSQGQTLKDGHTLLSTREIFELGFFTPGNSTHRYIGIWYYNISVQTVIWVANRKTPLTNSGGSLTFGSDGNLVLLNDQGNILWSTNLSVSSKTNSSVTAQILDMGKLVVLSGNQTVIWDSFDHPTDTFLPGMKIILDPKNGIRTLFTSWKSPNDPSVGKYSMGLDSSGSGQLFVYKGRRPRWRSGQFDGTQFIGSTMRPIYLYGFKIVISQGSMYATYEQFNSTLLRFVLQRDGVENTSMLVDDTKEWETVGVQPGNECETYGKCHNYGICSESSIASICSCLKGFEPRFGEEWNKGNWSGGCVRRTPLVCESNNNSNSTGNKGGDGFYRYQAVKVPDLSEWASLVTNEADCRSACSNNCSCKAYAYVAGIGCLMWARDLIDIAQFPQGSGTDLYIKLAASELGTKRKIWKVIVIVCASVTFLLIVCVLLWCKFNAFLKDLCKKRHEQQNSLPGSGEGRIDLPGSNDSGEGEEGKDAELPLFHFESLVKATNNFDDANKLGEGGFGAVYKGLLPGGQEVAVKRLSRSSGQGQEEFKNEMSLIAKLQHRNLVRLLGFCIQGDEKILIYEYMPNKSLDVLLFDPTRQQLLNWNGRFRIIEGIARGLVYLHRDSRLRIVHRDLKASNILLDGAMNPKISDFGIARIFGGDENQLNTNRVVGTFGYMSPEYAMEGLFSVKSDVYSFGVLVLEIVTGRRNNSFHDMDDTINIVGYAWQLWTEDKANEMIDPAILDPGSVDQIVRCIHVGLFCVQDRADDRPEMASVVLMLGSGDATLPMPKPPLFATEAGISMIPAIAYTNDLYSVNDVTITDLSGR